MVQFSVIFANRFFFPQMSRWRFLNQKCIQCFFQFHHGVTSFFADFRVCFFFCIQFYNHKVVDSWGKFPSGILSGNFYELGSFTECLNLKRNGERYESQYCLASVKANFNGLMKDEMQPRVAMPM